MSALSLICRRRSHPVRRLLWQLQPQPREPLERVPNAVTFLALPAFLPRGGYLHGDRGVKAEGRWGQHSLLQIGVPVPRGLQRPPSSSSSSSQSTAHIRSPHCRKEAMWVCRNLHKLVALSVNRFRFFFALFLHYY